MAKGEPRARTSTTSRSGPAEPVASRTRRSRTQRAKVGLTGFFGWLGIFGVGAALGAILGWQDVRGWLIGVVVSAVTVVLGYLLRRSLPTV